MPLGQRGAGDKSDSGFCGVETEFDDDMGHMAKALAFNVSGGFDFMVSPLMSVPASPHPPPPQFFQPFPPGNDNVRIWSEVPMENEQSKMANYPEFPPFKKPRNFEDSPLNSFPNQQNLNPRMPTQNPPSNRGIGKIFFKTRLCAKFKAGTCPYGDNCNFAHGIDDIRKPPPNWQEIVASHEDDRSGNWDEDQKIINRLKLCKKFCNGEECPYGERCNFLHKDIGKFREDPTRFRESSAISIGTTAGSPGSNGSGSDQPDGNGFLNSGVDGNWGLQKPVFWKTRICNKWETTGQCPFGEKCHFAHGLAELQKFGGHSEVEASNVSMNSTKPLPNPVNDASPSTTGTGDSCKQQVQSNKCLLKWKGTKKISRIYADWIDDMPLLLGSPTNLES